METTLDIVSIIIIVFGILQIILFFKVWGMTNDVSELKKMYEEKSEKLISSINKLVEETKKLDTKDEVKKEVKQTIIPLKKEEKPPQPYKDAPKKELPIIDENSNDFKQHLHKWTILKEKGYVEQAIREYMEYTQLDREFAVKFIDNL